jgi:uncharacterized protein YjiS (DUF1127 family)
MHAHPQPMRAATTPRSRFHDPDALAILSLWLRRSRTRAALQDLDAQQLADVGLTGRQRQRECAKWFWQA